MHSRLASTERPKAATAAAFAPVQAATKHTMAVGSGTSAAEATAWNQLDLSNWRQAAQRRRRHGLMPAARRADWYRHGLVGHLPPSGAAAACHQHVILRVDCTWGSAAGPPRWVNVRGRWHNASGNGGTW